MRITHCLTGLTLVLLGAVRAHSQEIVPDRQATLKECITYALKNQPALKQTQLGEEIARRDVSVSLADWLPQVNGNANLIENIKRPTNILQIGDQAPTTLISGTQYASTVGVSVNQVIFNNDVLLAKKTGSDYKQQAVQLTTEAKISVVVNVSKAYYQVLTTQQQISVYDQTIERLEKSYSDARDRYDAGVADNIDYKRAQISLNNTRAQRAGAMESYTAQKALLKQLMGYPLAQPLQVADDIEEMETESLLDTSADPDYTKRIEYQLLETQQRLNDAQVKYYRNGFIPELSAYYNYNWAYLNNTFSDLYNKVYPNSSVGVTLSVPLFTGMRRIRNLQRAKLQYQQLELNALTMESQITTEYTQALATYKSNLEQLKALRENYTIAEDVYNTVKLQYDEGIKAYLEVIVAESDLRTSQLNYLNALLYVLSSKLDVQKAAGTINITQ